MPVLIRALMVSRATPFPLADTRVDSLHTFHPQIPVTDMAKMIPMAALMVSRVAVPQRASPMLK